MRYEYPEPYIGITDFTGPEQVRRIAAIPHERVWDTKMDHLLGVGVMMSYKTLHGLPTKWSAAFPQKEKIAGIFLDDERVYNVLHYADYDDVSTARDFEKALSYCGQNLNAMQFDMIWPDARAIRAAIGRERGGPYPLKVILQVGRKAFARFDDDIEHVTGALKLYKKLECLDYVLLDRSGGEGKEMDSMLLLSYYRALRREFPCDELSIVMAGGLGPQSLDRLLAPFRADNVFTDLSIDAQGKLRPSGSALDPVDWNMAAEYYSRAVWYFGMGNYAYEPA